MSRRRPVLLLCLLAVLVPAGATPAGATPAGAAPRCHAGPGEVRFDDGRLAVTRDVRSADPRAVRERWWACWRPTGRRTALVDTRHRRGADELALLAVRRGRFVVLAGAGRLDVYDARRGGTTATMSQVGVVRELVVTGHGRLAALQDTFGGGRQLWAGNGTQGCMVDAGRATTGYGDVFGDLTVHHERLAWYRDGVAMGEDLSGLTC
ncbi:MAG TPA: hypothetical protein VFT50_02215 [Baekduia sp.]|nr:hypothetical protein [Baekduia sp.]